VFFTLNPGGADLYYLQRQAASYKRLAIWYNDVEDAGIDAFKTVSRSVQTHYAVWIRGAE
jgi:hypothetical protein